VLTAGIGYGGGCLPKDSRAFGARAAELGVHLAPELVDVVERVNRHQRQRIVDLAAEELGGSLEGRRLGVLGAAFKGGSDDLRESPALDVVHRLLAEQADLRVFDPAAGPRLREVAPDVPLATDPESACRDADLVMVLTDWPEFARLDPVALLEVVARASCIDGRQVVDAAKWRGAGWTVYVMGEGGAFRG